ncbi:MAG: BlaI/MecI/CopY family transcriptional regulator [Alistipes sp.]|nr:BlaI/MecI/CopY family transcriptional regulator [Alistipes sp.]
MKNTANDKELTRAELQVMQILWDLERGFVNDIIDRMESPKPAYNTVSTIVRILEKKGFVSHESFGKSHRYYPLISRSDYTDKYMNSVLSNFFDNSLPSMVSFFSRREKLSVREIDDIIRILQEGKMRNN